MAISVVAANEQGVRASLPLDTIGCERPSKQQRGDQTPAHRERTANHVDTPTPSSHGETRRGADQDHETGTVAPMTPSTGNNAGVPANAPSLRLNGFSARTQLQHPYSVLKH